MTKNNQKKPKTTTKEGLITAPVPGYSGISAGLQFVNGTAKTSDPWLLAWFAQHGYKVEGDIAVATPSPPAPDNGNPSGSDNETGTKSNDPPVSDGNGATPPADNGEGGE